MANPPIDVTVSGHAAGLTAAKNVADPWKTSVAQAVSDAWPGGYVKEDSAVRLTFDLEKHRFQTTAVYNLLKATVDGLGSAIFAPSRGGSQFHTEDWWITELHARKQCTAQAPSVRVEVGSTPPGFPYMRGVAIADVCVPGPPPPWPGDKVGAAKVLAWRMALARMLQVAQPVKTDASLIVDFQFAVTSAVMACSDLDNYCVPAAQAVCYGLFGSLQHSQRVLELHATKARARSANELGTRVRVWAA